jgi:hypothetical protein
VSEPITRIKAPVKITFDVPAGRAVSRFLTAIVDGRIVGQRCPSCHKVYVPPRGSCPTCAVALAEDVTVKDTGVVTSFCVVNVPFEGQTMKLPYIYACIALDGADLPIWHLVDGLPASEARMGLRVKAEWKPPAERTLSLESIRYFVPTGEPDADYDTYKEHL